MISISIGCSPRICMRFVLYVKSWGSYSMKKNRQQTTRLVRQRRSANSRSQWLRPNAGPRTISDISVRSTNNSGFSICVRNLVFIFSIEDLAGPQLNIFYRQFPFCLSFSLIRSKWWQRMGSSTRTSLLCRLFQKMARPRETLEMSPFFHCTTMLYDFDLVDFHWYRKG